MLVSAARRTQYRLATRSTAWVGSVGRCAPRLSSPRLGLCKAPGAPALVWQLGLRAASAGAGNGGEAPAQAGEFPILKRVGLHPSDSVNPNANKYIQLACACMTHASLGSVFALSVFNSGLTRLLGVVDPAALDWALGDVTMLFTLVISGFAWGGVFSKYHDRLGIRACGVLSAASLFGGWSLASLAASVHSLPLLYAGGLVWGMGIGWGYVPSVANALRWFPENKGIAGGSCVAGFAVGSIFAPPVFRTLMKHYEKAPQFSAPLDSIDIACVDGRLHFGSTEVVRCEGQEALAWGLSDGFYAVGTGSTGVAETFLTCGMVYPVAVLACALMAKTPAAVSIKQSEAIVDKEQWSRNFLLMTAGFAFASTGSYAVVTTGSTMLTDVFGRRLPELVTPGFVAAFVSLIGVGNLSGRVLWPAASDYLAKRWNSNFDGRKFAFTGMWTLGPMAYGGILVSPMLPGTYLPLGVFVTSSMLTATMLGGAAATRPAFVSDVWGQEAQSALLARSMPSLWAAAFVGPRVMAYSREQSVTSAATELTKSIDDATFSAHFHAPKEDLLLLLKSKTVTLHGLVDLAGPNVVDPTPFIYTEGVTVCLACQLLALGTNLALRPPPLLEGTASEVEDIEDKEEQKESVTADGCETEKPGRGEEGKK